MCERDIQWGRARHLLLHPSSGALWCQFNQPGSAILRHLCVCMHINTHAHYHQGIAELMTHLSAPPPFFSLCLSLPLYFSVSVCTGDITQKGYEKKRSKLLAPYIPQIQGKASRPAEHLLSRTDSVFTRNGC